MHLTHRIVDQKICVIEVVGSSVGARIEETVNFLDPFLGNPNIEGILLNFTNVDFVSSAGIGWVMFIFKTLKERGARFAICGLNSKVRSTFSMTGLDGMLRIYKDESSALAEF